MKLRQKKIKNKDHKLDLIRGSLIGGAAGDAVIQLSQALLVF